MNSSNRSLSRSSSKRAIIDEIDSDVEAADVVDVGVDSDTGDVDVVVVTCCCCWFCCCILGYSRSK